ncbi:hypothetical protein JL720_6803 [Aureococcus anophagefferens]|nr:hypothetical protein JL720_6803 [Aureococcus anophagefferens]
MSQSVAIKLKTSTAQPSDAEVEELFGRVLVALCLPAAAVANLTANESVANKWRMVQMNAALLESGRSTQMSDGDAALLEAIRVSPTLADVRELRKRLATGSRGWLDAFYERDGLALLASTLAVALAGPAHRFGEKDGCLALAALGCVRAAFHAPHSFCGGAVAAVALELLAVGSHFGKAAAVRAALPSLEALAAVGGAAPVEVRAAALTLANEVVSGGDDLETRAALRFALRACFDGAAAAETSGSDLAKSTLGRMVGTKATKRRVYTIKHGRLSWADDDAGTSGGAPKRRGSATDEARFVDLATVKAVRAYSDEGGLGGLCAFEVVAEKKTLALAAETRSDKDAWLDALKVAVDRAALARDVGDVRAPFLDVLAPLEPRASSVCAAQREAFFAIADADRAEALSRDGVDLSDAAAVLGRVAAGAAKAGKARAVGELAIAALKALDDATAARWSRATAALGGDAAPEPEKRPIQSVPEQAKRVLGPKAAKLPAVAEEAADPKVARYERMLKMGLPAAPSSRRWPPRASTSRCSPARRPARRRRSRRRRRRGRGPPPMPPLPGAAAAAVPKRAPPKVLGAAPRVPMRPWYWLPLRDVAGADVWAAAGAASDASLVDVGAGERVREAPDYDPSITALRDVEAFLPRARADFACPRRAEFSDVAAQKLGDVLDACGAVAAAAAAARERRRAARAGGGARRRELPQRRLRGEAGGFDLDGVAKLATTKGADGTTLAMHVVAGVDRRDSGARDSAAGRAAFGERLGGFAAALAADADSAKAALRREAALDAARAAFGDDSKQPFDLFRKLLTLVRTLKTAHEANRRRAKPKADAKGGDLFDAFSKTQDDARR